MIKLVVVAVLIAAALVTVKRENLVERSGVVSSCNEVAAPAGDDGSWVSCREGILTGYPSLGGDSCELRARTKDRQVWRCPAPIATSWTR